VLFALFVFRLVVMLNLHLQQAVDATARDGHIYCLLLPFKSHVGGSFASVITVLMTS